VRIIGIPIGIAKWYPCSGTPDRMSISVGGKLRIDRMSVKLEAQRVMTVEMVIRLKRSRDPHQAQARCFKVPHVSMTRTIIIPS